MRVGLVGCVKSKRAVSAPARDLYTSPLFRGRRSFVERSCDRWFVLSAKHGLLEPNDTVQPYDVTLLKSSVQVRREWSQGVIAELKRRLVDLRLVTFEVHAGATYRDYGLVEGLVKEGAIVENPVQGLSQGQQLRFYASDAAR